MSDYISREAVLNASKIVYIEYLETDDDQYIEGECDFIPVVFKKDIEKIPSADVVERKRGKWEQKEVFTAKGNVDELQSAFCPVCQRYHTTPYSYYFTNYNFCPNCGADMRGET